MDKASISVRYGKKNLERYFVNIINSSSGSALQFERRRRKGGVGRMMWRSLREMKTNQKDAL